MRDSKSWTEILIFNHHLSGPMKSYHDFLFHKDLFAIKNPIDKILFTIAVYQKTDSNCPLVIFCFYLLFFLPHFDTILHIAVISIFIEGPHIFLKIISNFMLLERPLSLKQTFHYHTQINRQRDRIIRMQQSTYKFFYSLFFSSYVPARCIVFLFSFCSFRAGPFLL